MKKRLLSILLAVLLIAALVPTTAFAATGLEAPIISDLRVPIELGENNNTNLEFYMTVPQQVKDALEIFEAEDFFEPVKLETWVNVNNTGWVNQVPGNAADISEGTRMTSWDATYGDKDDFIQLKARLIDRTGRYGDSDFSNILTLNAKAYEASEWAQDWIEQADELGLIPDCLVGQDLTKEITRQEFAAVAVKIYESLTQEAATPVAVNPFTDCNDLEVLKGYNIGITNGTAADKFAPNEILNREQLATMLTRIYKKVALEGWTLANDSSFTAQFKALFSMPTAFADDSAISAWAKDSVYFMKSQGIIDGVGSNMFAPKHGMTTGEAAGYGLATREQALKIAVGMVQKLK